MKNTLLKKGMIIGIIFLCIGTSYSQMATSTRIEKTLNSKTNFSDYEYEETCYGFAIPLTTGENLPYTSIQQNIANLINDLLRLNISVFWASQNFSARTIRFINNSAENRFFEIGTFLVPLSGNLSQNALLSVIINDYADANEIQLRDRVDVYFLLEPLHVESYPLNRAKIGYHFGAGVHYYLLLCYLDSLQFGGFLDNQILLDDDIATELNNNDLNVFIWPGANLGLGFMGCKGTTKTKLHIRASQQIRRFVQHGGGYIGSCYGKGSASAGFLIPRNLLAHYFPNLPVTGNLALLPSFFISNPGTGYITVKIVNTSHPVSYGISQIQRSFYGNGPVDICLGKDTQSLATLENFSFQYREKDFPNLPYCIIEFLIKLELGNPIWTTGIYFDGKIVVFGDHPEMPEPYRLDRLIHNAVFFTTADQNTIVLLSQEIPLLQLTGYMDATRNLSLSETSPRFPTLWEKIDALFEICNKIDALEKDILNVALELADEGKIDSTLQYQIATEYREPYRRWLRGFEDALQRLEKISTQVETRIDISNDLETWETCMNQTLDTYNQVCMKAYELSKIMRQKVMTFSGSSKETLLLQFSANARDRNFRNGSKQIILPWMATEKISRMIWYFYERDIALASDPEKHPLISLTIAVKRYNTIDSKSARNIYVDIKAAPNGNGSTNHPYRSIQDAIDASSDNDTIYVSKGIYKGSITIHKSITLIGENKYTTIIDGEQKPHHIVTTTAPHVQIRGFTIRNSSKELVCGGIVFQDSYNSATDNILTENRLGLGLRPTVHNNSITNNIFINNSYIGLGIDDVDQTNNTICNNTFIQNNQHGLSVYNVFNTIDNNTFVNDSITLIQNNESLLVKMNNNTINGKPLYCLQDTNDVIISGEIGEVIISHCRNITLQNITIHNIDIPIFIIHSDSITITNSTLGNNLVGIKIQNTQNLIVKNNIIKNNTWSGIWISNSENIQICNNTLDRNDDGLLLQASTRIQILNNSITKNAIGISFFDQSNNNRIATNNFLDNINNAFDKCKNVYSNNYWDDWVGLQRNLLKFLPYHVKGRVIWNFDWHPAQEPYDLPRITI